MSVRIYDSIWGFASDFVWAGRKMLSLASDLGSGNATRVGRAISWIDDHTSFKLFGVSIAAVPLLEKTWKKVWQAAVVLGEYAWIVGLLERWGHAWEDVGLQAGPGGHVWLKRRKYGSGWERKWRFGWTTRRGLGAFYFQNVYGFGRSWV